MMKRKLKDVEVKKLNKSKALKALLYNESFSIDKTLRYLDYERKLRRLQV